MSKMRRSSVATSAVDIVKAKKCARKGSLVPPDDNGSSPVLRRHKQRQDDIRERRLLTRSDSVDSPVGKKSKKKKKKKKKKKSKPKRPSKVNFKDLPTITIESEDFSPVRDAIVIREGAFVADTDLNISLSNLGLNTVRPLIRLGDKPLFAVESSGERSILKKIDLSEPTSYNYKNMTWFEYCMREPMFMRKLGTHENIVSMKKFHVEGNTLIIDMELTPKGDLYTIVSDQISKNKTGLVFTEAKVRFLVQQILNGLDFMHSQGIAHRDIKLENILYFQKPKKTLKICDFEFACNIDTDDVEILATTCGTWYAMPPEIVVAYQMHGKQMGIALACDFQCSRDGEPRTVSWDWRKSDIWACGVLMYVCFHGRYPFEGLNENGKESFESMYDDLFLKKLTFDGALSKECKSVIKAMLSLSYGDRPTAKQVLKMDWFNSGDQSPNLGVFPSSSGSEILS